MGKKQLVVNYAFLSTPGTTQLPSGSCISMITCLLSLFILMAGRSTRSSLCLPVPTSIYSRNHVTWSLNMPLNKVYIVHF